MGKASRLAREKQAGMRKLRFTGSKASVKGFTYLLVKGGSEIKRKETDVPFL